MRYFTAVLAVAVVAAILCTSALIYVESEDSREISRNLKEKYDIEGFWKEMADNGLSVFHPGRLWPGSIDSDVGSPVIDLSEHDETPCQTLS